MAQKCSFCGGPLETARGKMYVKTDGRVYYFHDATCERHFLLGREGKHVKWTTISRKLRSAPAVAPKKVEA